jgi:hypothetical protein
VELLDDGRESVQRYEEAQHGDICVVSGRDRPADEGAACLQLLRSLWTQTIHSIKTPLARQMKLYMSTPTATPNTSGGTWAAMAASGEQETEDYGSQHDRGSQRRPSGIR